MLQATGNIFEACFLMPEKDWDFFMHTYIIM
jgi:hypothetical protein